MEVEINSNVLEAIKKVPLLSPSVSQLLNLTSDPDFALPELTKVIGYDAILTAKVIKTVNSAAYNLPVEVDSVERATAMLGARLIVGIALSNAGDGLMTGALPGYEGPDDGVWRHDLFCAIAARKIGERAKVEFKIDIAFTGGLLHDIGKAVISEFLTGTSTALLAGIDNGSTGDYLAGEKSILGLDHAEVGFEIAKAWELPEVLQNMIRYHHNPSDAPEQYRVACYAVHLGDVLSMMAGQGTGSDAMQYRLDEKYSQYYDIDENELSRILIACNEEFHEIEAVMATVMSG